MSVLSCSATAHFATGTDGVVFCAGYFYSYPFIDRVEIPLCADGIWVRKLSEHMLYINDLTPAFLGIPQRIVPVPIAEAQAGFVARIWAIRLPLPYRKEMLEWEDALLKHGSEGRLIHNFAFLKDVNYINGLYHRNIRVKRVPALDNDVQGKIPPCWGNDKAWVRERFPTIEAASQALGDKRHKVRTLQELGSDYNAYRLAGMADNALPRKQHFDTTTPQQPKVLSR